MFNLKDFVMKALKGMVGNYPEFQVREYALGWYIKKVLTDEDLNEIEVWFTPVEEPEVNIPVMDVPEYIPEEEEIPNDVEEYDAVEDDIVDSEEIEEESDEDDSVEEEIAE